MIIDVRSFPERQRFPEYSDLQIETPIPPLSPEEIYDMAATLFFKLADIDKETPIEIFCARGVRSALAVQILKQAGFTDVYDLGGVHPL